MSGRTFIEAATVTANYSRRFCSLDLVARGINHRAGVGLDPDKVVPYSLHSWHIFRGHGDRLALAFVRDGAPELDGCVLDDDVDQGGRRPGLASELSQQLLANGLIAGRHRLDVGRNAGERMQ